MVASVQRWKCHKHKLFCQNKIWRYKPTNTSFGEPNSGLTISAPHITNLLVIADQCSSVTVSWWSDDHSLSFTVRNIFLSWPLLTGPGDTDPDLSVLHSLVLTTGPWSEQQWSLVTSVSNIITTLTLLTLFLIIILGCYWLVTAADLLYTSGESRMRSSNTLT